MQKGIALEPIKKGNVLAVVASYDEDKVTEYRVANENDKPSGIALEDAAPGDTFILMTEGMVHEAMNNSTVFNLIGNIWDIINKEQKP